MGEDSLPNEMLGALEEAKIRRFASIAIVGGDGFIDEREEVAVEGHVEPGRSLRSFLRRGESVFEFACS